MKKGFEVTPWKVSGKVDYEKLIKEFGISKVDNKLLNRIKKHTKELHPMLRRGVFFAHRDLNWLLDEYEKGNKFFLYTGRGPSGKMHLGHLLPFIMVKWLQDKFNCEVIIQLTDDEKFWFSKKSTTLKEAKSMALENAADIIALGFKPQKTKIIIDTQHINSLYPLAAEVAKKVTFSMVKAVFGFTNDTNIGSIFYTSIQSAPCFLRDQPCLIPLGIDQDPHFRITRDIAQKINKRKPAILHSMFLPSLKGPEAKSSSSEELSAIFTTDSPTEVKNKINKYAFSGGQATTGEHREKGGNPDVDVSFQYLKFLFEPDDKKLQQIYNDYKSGKLLTSELKQITIDKINIFLKQHRARRQKAKKQINKFLFKM